MYLSDKRAINLFAAVSRCGGIKARGKAPICWFTGDMAAADSGGLFPFPERLEEEEEE